MARGKDRDPDQLDLATGRALRYLLDPPSDRVTRVSGVRLRVSGFDVLLVYKVEGGEGPQIAFCGASDGAGAIRKGAAQLRDGTLKFRADKAYVTEIGADTEGWV